MEDSTLTKLISLDTERTSFGQELSPILRKYNANDNIHDEKNFRSRLLQKGILFKMFIELFNSCD